MIGETHQGVGEGQPNLELRDPFFDVVENDARQVFSENNPQTASFKAVLKDIGHQAVNNFAIWRSSEYADTGFSTTSIVVDRQMVNHAINPEDNSVQEPTEAHKSPKKRVFWFIEPHFHMGSTAGGAFWTLATGTDRTFRGLTEVANDPGISFRTDLLGSPVGFKGRAGKKFTQEAVDDGFDAHGKLYAEYIEQAVGEIDENTRIVINGASRGAVTAEKTYHFVIERFMQKHARQIQERGEKYGPEEEKIYRQFLYQHIQGLYDEPAGVHRKDLLLPFKAANEAGLMIEDTVRRFGFKEGFLSKDFEAKEKAFLANFGQDVPEYTPEDLARARRVAGAEAFHLVLGNPQDRTEPGHNRLPVFDPTNTRPGKIIRELFRRHHKPNTPGEREEWESEESKLEKGGKRTTVIKRLGHYHAFWRDSYSRWEKNIAAVRRWAPNPH